MSQTISGLTKASTSVLKPGNQDRLNQGVRLPGHRALCRKGHSSFCFPHADFKPTASSGPTIPSGGHDHGLCHGQRRAQDTPAHPTHRNLSSKRDHGPCQDLPRGQLSPGAAPTLWFCTKTADSGCRGKGVPGEAVGWAVGHTDTSQHLTSPAQHRLLLNITWLWIKMARCKETGNWAHCL